MPRARSTRVLAVVGLVLIACGVGAWLLIRPPAASKPAPGCVILITIDTLRADRLGCYGARRVRTPSLDRLAAESTLFERAYSPSPWTKPAVTSMLTGLDPAVHGIVSGGQDDPPLPGSVELLAERMHDAGYRTGAFGYNPYVAMVEDLRRGFRDYFIMPRLDAEIPLDLYEGIDPRDTTAAISGITERWLAQRGDERFFCWMHFYDPHLPYDPPKDYWTDDHRSQPDPAASRGPTEEMHSQPFYRPDDNERRQLRGLYDSEIQYVDDAVGRVIATLKRLGRYEDALIIVSSDHGEEFWEHGGFEHGHTAYDELLHVPLFVRTPHAASRRVATAVDTPSIYATIADACGLEPAEHAFATAPSLWPSIVEGVDPAPRDAIFAGFTLYWEPQRTVRFGRYKFVHKIISNDVELYDIEADPGETTPIGDANPALVKRGRALLEAHRAWAEELRGRLRISSEGGKEMGEARKKLLRSHGYLK